MNQLNLIYITTSLPGSKTRKRGSGYVVGDQLILTALHIVTNDPSAAVKEPSRVTGVVATQFQSSGENAPHRELAVECVAACDKSDVALLRLLNGCVFSKGWVLPQFATVDHNSGNVDCTAVGFPKVASREGPRPYDISGTFRPFRYIGDKHLAIAVRDSPVEYAAHWSGMSGAALLHKETGALIGVVVNAPEIFRGKEIGFTPLGHFVQNLAGRNDGQAGFLPEACMSLSPIRQGIHYNEPLEPIVEHLYSLDYASQIQIAQEVLNQRKQYTKPIFMLVRGLRSDLLPDIRYKIQEEVLQSRLPGRATGTKHVDPRDGKEGSLKVEVPGSRTCALQDMSHVRAKFLRELNVSNRHLDARNFVENIQELIRAGDCPRVFYSCLSMSRFDNKVRRALDDWMHDWIQISNGFDFCGFVYIYLVEKVQQENSISENSMWPRWLDSVVRGWWNVDSVDDFFLSMREVEGVTCVDLQEVEAVAWNPDIQNWLVSDRLRTRLHCTTDEFRQLERHALLALEVSDQRNEFRMGEIRNRFVSYRTNLQPEGKRSNL